MFCGKCGAENDNGALFCRSCGKPLGSNKVQQTTSSLLESNDSVKDSMSRVDISAKLEKAKGIPKKFIAVACALVVALIAITVVMSETKKTVDLNNYLEIEAEGYDGFGRATATIDWKAIEAKYGNQISFTKYAQSETARLIGILTPVEALQECVSVKLNDNTKLSNGAAVEYKWEIDEDLSKILDCKVKYKDGNYTVTGLTEVGKFDAFSDMTVEFTGIAPNGKASINYLGSELNYYDFDCDKTNGLSNGDTVKVTIDENKIEYFAENLGKIPEELEKEFKVEGLESFVTRISEVDDEAMKAMQQQAEDVYNANVAKNWGEGESLESLTCIGEYLLSAKNSDTWGSNNHLILVYKAQVRNTYSNDKGASYNKVNDVYWYIRFSDLMVGSDGKTAVNVTSYDTPYDRFTVDSGVDSGWWSTKQWYYNGYTSIDELYKTAVVTNIDSYNHEDNIDESVVPKVFVEEETKMETSDDFVLPKSDTDIISKDDLNGLTAEECKIARNEIYARHGRKFKDAKLQEYFSSKSWYQGTIEPDDFNERDLNEIEIKNKDLIIEFEKENGFN